MQTGLAIIALSSAVFEVRDALCGSLASDALARRFRAKTLALKREAAELKPNPARIALAALSGAIWAIGAIGAMAAMERRAKP